MSLQKYIEQHQLNEALMEAAAQGNVNLVLELLDKGALINYQDNVERTPLHMAAENGQYETSAILLEKRSDATLKDFRGSLPIHEASMGGHLKIVEMFIEHDHDSSAKDYKGFTPLHYASREGHLSTVQFLLTCKVNYSSTTNEGLTAYDLAQDREIKDTLRKLMQFERMGNPNDFKRLLSFGTFRSYNNIVYLAGACNVGKSTLAGVMLGIFIPSEWNSTDGLNIYFGQNGIDLEKRIMIPLKQGIAGHDVFDKVLRGDPEHVKVARPMENTLTVCTEKQQENEVEDEGSFKDSPPIQASERKDISVVQKAEKREETGSQAQSFFNSILQWMRKLTKRDELTETKITRMSAPSELNIHENILEKIRKGEYKMEIAPSDLIDFGGQKSFDMTHQLFIRQKGSFVLMFDGRYDFLEKLREYPQGNITNHSILTHWVSSILTYCTEDDNPMPMILFAATHSDFFKKGDIQVRKDYFIKELTKMFSEHEQRDHIIFNTVFFINATNPLDPEIDALTKRIVEIAFSQKSWGEPMPMAWVPLDVQISRMRASNITFITRESLMGYNLGNGDLSLSLPEFEQFLKAQHSLGKIVYFSDHDLNEFVAIQPSALVNILRAFITDEIFWPKDKKLREIHANLNQSGKITRQDLISLWTQKQFNSLIPDVDLKHFIIKVLVHLDILVEPKFHKEVDQEREKPPVYIVPCMIKQSPPADFLQDDGIDEKAICLSYRLLKSAVPSALSFKLIGAVLTIWPLKEQCGRVFIFQKSAALHVDEHNELRILLNENRVLVYLVHAESKAHISPDIAASIQECLTLSLSNVLIFYYKCAGRDIASGDVQKLFETEVGVVCQREPCLINLSLANEKHSHSWTCHNCKTHETKYPLYWQFDKTVGLEKCPAGCTGLSEELLGKCPSGKHLVRIAEKVGINTFYKFVIELGLSKADWDDTDFEYRSYGLLCVKFMALCKWREQKEKSEKATFKDLSLALKEAEGNQHYLCQIFRERTDIIDNADSRLQIIPKDEVLQKLPRKIGNCSMQLGIELDLDIGDIEETIYRYPKSIFDQTYDILRKWKQRSKVNRLFRLMQALQRVNSAGLTFLRQEYKLY